MTSLKDNARFCQAIGCISQRIYPLLKKTEQRLCDEAQEIRLRVNRPLCIVCHSQVYYMTEYGELTTDISDSFILKVTKKDITDTFHNICNHSVYSRQDEIVNGFVTMTGGHRAGICGTAVTDGHKITNIRDISSINIRIAREHRDCARPLLDSIDIHTKGLLICGEPCSGKTTVLRDMARLLSTEYKYSVSLIDERGELAGTAYGEYQNDIGLCDVYDGYKKSDGIIQAVRSMAPQIIICDEIGAEDDITAIIQTINCGVRMVATVHAHNRAELKGRQTIMKILKTGAFENIVFLSGRNHPGEITDYCKAGDILAS